MIMAITAYSTVDLGRIPQVTRVCMSVVVFCVIVFTRVKCYMWFMTLTYVCVPESSTNQCCGFILGCYNPFTQLPVPLTCIFILVCADGGGNL